MIWNQGGQGEISEEETKDSRFSQPLSKGEKRDFPGSPVIKTLPSKAGMRVRSLIGELRSHILLAWPKKKRKKISSSPLLCSQTMQEGQRQRTTSHSRDNREAPITTPLGKLQGGGQQAAYPGLGAHLEERSPKLGLSHWIGEFPGGLLPQQSRSRLGHVDKNGVEVTT